MSKRIILDVDKELHEQISKQAEELRLPISTYVRIVVIEKIKKEKSE